MKKIIAKKVSFSYVSKAGCFPPKDPPTFYTVPSAVRAREKGQAALRDVNLAELEKAKANDTECQKDPDEKAQREFEFPTVVQRRLNGDSHQWTFISIDSII